MASPVNTITLTDSNSVVYTFNESFEFKGNDYRFSSRISKRAFAHGGVDTGSGKTDSQRVRLNGWIFGATDTVHRDDYDALMRAVVKEDQELRWGDQPRFIKIKRVRSVRQEYEENIETVSKMRIDFQTEDPFWHFEVPNSIATALNSPISVFTLTNSGNVDTFPVFTLVSSDSNSTGVTLKNVSDDNNLMVYSDINLTADTTLTIDNAIGTVDRGGINTLRNFTGQFLRLVTGVNTFEFTGAKALLTAVYRERIF